MVIYIGSYLTDGKIVKLIQKLLETDIALNNLSKPCGSGSLGPQNPAVQTNGFCNLRVCVEFAIYCTFIPVQLKVFSASGRATSV